MFLFDANASAIQSQASGTSGASSNLLESVMGMISNPETGGLAGLVQKISTGGLSEQVASWVGTGKNLPVSAEQIQSMLRSSGLQDVANEFGFNTSEAVNQLSSLLPQVIDKLTPNGQVPEGGDFHQYALASVSSLFGNKSA